MSEVKVLNWNLRSGGLADPERAEQIAELISDINPDIAMLEEAAPEGKSTHVNARKILLENVGTVHRRNYDDIDGRKDRHALIAVAKSEYGAPAISYPGQRVMMTFRENLDYEVSGMHGHDRSNGVNLTHDEARQFQIKMFITAASQRAVLLGDLNSLHADDATAKRLRSAARYADMLPSKAPGEKQSPIERIGSLAQRLCAMAEGGSIGRLEAAGFQDVDSKHQSTMRKLGLSVQLDHIMTRGVENMGDFTVHDNKGLSDHYPISVTLFS